MKIAFYLKSELNFLSQETLDFSNEMEFLSLPQLPHLPLN